MEFQSEDAERWGRQCVWLGGGRQTEWAPGAAARRPLLTQSGCQAHDAHLLLLNTYKLNLTSNALHDMLNL